jgi:hypothetical protein
MFRKEVLKTALPFYSLRPLPEMYHHDMWLAMHACVHGRVVGLKEPLVHYRQHSGNLVGVAALRRKLKLRGLVRRAGSAFKERWTLRQDFLDSLMKQKEPSFAIEQKKLSYLDSTGALLCTGLKYVWAHPLFFRTWVMLAVGFLNFHLKKNDTRFLTGKASK